GLRAGNHPPRVSQPPRWEGQLLYRYRHRTTPRYLSARQHGLLHQLRPLLPHRRHPPPPPAPAPPVLRDPRPAPEPLRGRPPARSVPPRPQLPPGPLPDPRREAAHRLGTLPFAPRPARRRPSLRRLARSPPPDAPHRRPFLGPGPDQRPQRNPRAH